MFVDEIPTYIMTMQPEECRNCGARTEFWEVLENKQFHFCPSCKTVYIVTENKEEE